MSIDNFKINNIKKSDKSIEFVLKGQKYNGILNKENFEIKQKQVHLKMIFI